MSAVVLDADAFVCLRSLDLLEPALNSPAALQPTVHLLGQVANNELHDLSPLVQEFVGLGVAQIESILARTAESRSVRDLRKRHKIDKGEAEAIAWLLARAREDRLPFVTCDGRARQAAAKEKLRAWNPVDVACHWLDLGLLSTEQCNAGFQRWVDDPHAAWRTPGFTTFENALTRWREGC